MASIINASSSGSGGIVQTADASGVLQLQSNGTLGIGIDANLKIGIGAMPNASWSSSSARPVIEFSATSNAYVSNQNTGTLSLARNWVYNGSNNVYAVADTAQYLSLQSTGFQFLAGASGSAGSTISYSTLMNITNAGQVTKAYQPMFAMSISGTPSMTGGGTTVPFGVSYLNVGSSFNTSTYTFTAPVAGYYMFLFGARVDSYTANKYMHYRAVKNGAVSSGGGSFFGGDFIMTAPSTNPYQGAYMSWIYYLSANDTVAVRNDSEVNAGTYLGYQSWFNGYLLG